MLGCVICEMDKLLLQGPLAHVEMLHTEEQSIL